MASKRQNQDQRGDTIMRSTAALTKEELSNGGFPGGSEVPGTKRSSLLWGQGEESALRVGVSCPRWTCHLKAWFPDPAESAGSPHQGY